MSLKNPALQPVFDAFTYRTLPTVLLALGGLYLLYSVGHWFILPPPARGIMVTVALISALLCTLTGLYLWSLQRKHLKTFKGVQSLVAGLCILILFNTSLHMILTRDPLQSSNFILLVLGAASLLLSIRWFSGILLVIWIGWLSCMFLIGPVSEYIWGHFSFAMVAGSLVACLLQWTRLNSYAQSEQHRQHAATNALRFRRLVAASFEGIAVVHKDTIQDANPRMAEMFGYSLEELRHTPLSHLSYPDIQEALHLQAITQERPHNLEGIRQDGTRFPLAANSRSLGDKRDTWLLAIRDLSEERELERMKAEFISTVSHELRTPLTTIVGTLKLLGSGTLGEQSPQAQMLLQRALSNSDRLHQLINDLLEFNQQGPDIDLDVRSVPVQLLMSEAVKAYLPLAQRKNIQFKVREVPSHLKIQVSSSKIINALGHYLDNALKFSETGSTIEVRAHTFQQRVRIEVEDSGIGIDRALEDRLFQQFVQGDASDTRKSGGTGIGLSVVKSIAQSFGGTAGYQRKNAGQGSVFYIEFPYTDGL